MFHVEPPRALFHVEQLGWWRDAQIGIIAALRNSRRAHLSLLELQCLQILTT
jgi:hypothetical protein